jgi:hypothetical protein
VLDPALTRPGRLSRRVAVPLPDERGRAEILAVHMRGVPFAPGLDKAAACASLAKITAGFSGAELANVVNEAALLAGRKEAEVQLPPLLSVPLPKSGVPALLRGARPAGSSATHRGAVLWAAACGGVGWHTVLLGGQRPGLCILETLWACISGPCGMLCRVQSF